MKPSERRELIAKARKMARLLDRTGTPRIARLLRNMAEQVEYLETFRDKSKQHDKDLNYAIEQALEASAQMSEALGNFGTAHSIRKISQKQVKQTQLRGKRQ
jgi:hypothetical protein